MLNWPSLMLWHYMKWTNLFVIRKLCSKRLERRTAEQVYVLLDDDANEEIVDAFAEYYDNVRDKLNGNMENMEDRGGDYKEGNVLRLKR